MVEALWYKLIYFGVPVGGSAEVFFENNSVVNNSSIPTSVLKKYS